MAAPSPEKEKKTGLVAAAAQKPAADAAKPEIAREKEALGALLRPEAAAQGGALEVGGKAEPAEKEADTLADAVLEDAPAETESTGEPKEKDQTEDETPAPGVPLPRGPPALALAVDNTVRRTTAQGGQPHLDSLSATPSLPGGMVEVGVAAKEENEFEEMTGSDFVKLGQGEGLQPKFLPGQGGERRFRLAARTAALIRGARGGAPLPRALRARIEGRLWVDLSAVRVHTGAEARILCAALGARAFAHGSNIWLRAPAEAADTHLMAHEAVHTIQQGSARRRARPCQHEPAHRPRMRARPQLPRAPPVTADRPAAVRRLSDEGDSGFLARQAERLADRLDSYGVLKVLIGRRLFTGQTVNASAVDFCGAFMKFIGAEKTFEQMKQSGSLQKGFDAIKAGLTTYDISWNRVKRTFERARDEFEWTSPIASLKRIFGPFFSDVLSYGLHVLKIVARLVAEAFIISFGPMGKKVWEKIEAIGDTLGLIVQNPLQFAKNLISAVGKGIKGFGERIWDHIKAGLLGWILGPLAAMGVQLPAQLDLKGIVSVILQVLGLTYPQLRPRIVRALNPNGEVKVSVVERIIEVVNILRTEGLAGIWRKLMDYVQNLQMTVINGVKNWAVRAIVQAGIRKLVAWTNPAGALIDILMTIYNLIVFFIERFQQILDFASSIFDSIGKIARGALGDAAQAVEGALAKTIPIIISFLVRLLGLPDIGGTIRDIITKIRAKVGQAVDKVLDWVIKKVKKLIAKLVSKFRRGHPPDQAAFAMDGVSHRMWADDSQGRVRIMMASEPKEVPEDADQVSIREHGDSADHASDPQNVDAISQPHRAVMEEAKKVNKLPEANRSTPSVREALNQKINEFTPKLEQASTRPDNAAEIAQQTEQMDIDGAEKETAVDRTVYPFRRRIRTTLKIEGAAGNWKDMSVMWESAKKNAPNDADVYANLARDHIPEFATLARVSRMAKPILMRTGGKKPPLQPLFPELKAIVKNTETEGKASSVDLPVIVIRTRINSELGASSGIYAAWESNFTKDEELWIPTAFQGAPAGKEAEAATARLLKDYGAEALITDMQGHIDALKAKYEALPPHTVDEGFGKHVDSKATPVLQTITRKIFGGAGSGPTKTEGAHEGINIPYDEVMEAAELQMASYKQLKAQWTHNDLQAHHLLESSIVTEMRERAKSLKLAAVLGAEADTLAERTLAQSEQRLTAAQKSALSKDPQKAKQIDKAKAALSAALNGATLNCGMKTGQGVQDNGVAIYVLSSVNQMARSQPPSNIDTALAKAEVSFRSANAAPLREALAGPLGKAVTNIADGTGFDAAAVRKESQGAIIGLSDRMNAGLSDDWKGAFGELTANAYATFKQLQAASIAEIDAANDKATYNSSAEMRGRFEKLTQEAVVNMNLTTWF